MFFGGNLMSWASRTTRTRRTKRAPPKITVAANAKPTLLGRRQKKNKKRMHQEKMISRIRAFFYLVREDEVGMLPRPFSGLFHLVR